jgi:hypothetical protein
MKSEDLKIMFGPFVNRVLELVDGQAAAVAKNNGRVKITIRLYKEAATEANRLLNEMLKNLPLHSPSLFTP